MRTVLSLQLPIARMTYLFGARNEQRDLETVSPKIRSPSSEVALSDVVGFVK